LSGLPHKSRTPIYVTLAVAAGLVLWGFWMASAAPAGVAETRAARSRELAARRDKGLAALAGLERRHAAGAIDEDIYIERRRALIADLEQVYSELDEHGGLPGGGQGLAA
jgi:hypothetical protein